MYSHGTFSPLNYNIFNGKNNKQKGPWRQFGGTGFTINENYRAIKADQYRYSQHLGQWLWERIEEKNNKSKVFISAYRPCKNTKLFSSVYNQQFRYFQIDYQNQDPDIHEIFDIQLC